MKALIAMSGGVDSSVSAYILKRDGYDCSGIMMLLCPGSDLSSDEEMTGRASAVCRKMDIPFEAVELRDEFRSTVIEDFISSYISGITPNPCIICNKYMKFGRLMDIASKRGFDRFATGHYARVIRNEDTGLMELHKAKDPSKDQTYVLYNMNQEVLSRVLFPLGDLTKAEVRKIAAEAGFENASSKESQDICFIPDGDYAAFLGRNASSLPPEGNFVTEDGKILGTHKGITNYTIGQRKGLGISSDAPLFVIKIRPETNEVVLSHGEGLFMDRLHLRNVNWISGMIPEAPVRAAVKVRYKHQEQPASITVTGSDTAMVVFDEAVRAPTPGQSAVFYDGDNVLGGGVICSDGGNT